MSCQREIVALIVILAPLGTGFYPKERQKLVWEKRYYLCLTIGHANRSVPIAMTQGQKEHAPFAVEMTSLRNTQRKPKPFFPNNCINLF